MADASPLRRRSLPTDDDAAEGLAAQLRDAGFHDAHEIGRGAMGIVYRCEEVGPRRVVAVKVLTATSTENRRLFVRQQRAVGDLTAHPNIVMVLEIGETSGGHPYVVMPHCSRGSLEDHLNRCGALPLQQALQLGIELAEALASAHRFGIMHRDVKPTNVLLTDFGQHALADFDVAREGGTDKTGPRMFTAPELTNGRQPSPVADVYALGATLYCALVGQSAYGLRATEQRVVADLHELGVPDDVSATISKAMSRGPGNRPSAAEFSAQLGRLRAQYFRDGDDNVTRIRPTPLPRRLAGNLPAPLAAFVGRGTELSDLRDLLATCRLVTLLGVGGVGKTSLALQAARREAASFRDGVWWVELADVRDGLLLTDVVAAALGVRDHSTIPLIRLLASALAGRESLLVLDNCEHIANDVAQLVETLLRSCPRLQVLITSREVLRITGESVLTLSPMAYPGTDAAPGLAGLVGYDAVAFFVDRANNAQPGFTLTDENAALVAGLCAGLDGLPLAIELATARLRAMSLEQIVERLPDRFGLLTRGRRDAPTRQQTLTWCFEWSYDRCTAAERQLWKRLSVFAGSFDIDAAYHVCAEDLPFDDFLDDVCALVDKSIIVRMERGGTARLRLLETVREFGIARIESPEEHWHLQQRHLDWYLRLLTRAADEWFSTHQLRWLDRLTTEMPNLREALQFAVEDAPASALPLTVGMSRVWMSRAMLLSEARRWLDLALSGNPVEPTTPRIRTLGFAAMVAAWQGDVSAGIGRITEARQLLAAVTDARVHGLVDYAEGYARAIGGDIIRAQPCLERALTQPADLDIRTVAMIQLSWCFDALGDIETSVNWLDKALALTAAHGETVNRSRVLLSLTYAYWRQGDLTRMAQSNREALRLAVLVDDLWLGAGCLEAEGWIAEAYGRPRRAAVLLAAAARLIQATRVDSAPYTDVKEVGIACRERIRDMLGENEFRIATNEGWALSFADAATVALEPENEP